MAKNKKSNDPLDNIKLHYDKSASSVAVYLSQTAISDSLKADKFKDYLIDIVNKGMKKVVVDLGYCSSAESTFIGVLLTSLNKFISENKGYKLLVKFDGKSSILELSRNPGLFKKNHDLNSDFEDYFTN